MLVVEAKYARDGEYVLVCADDRQQRQYVQVSAASYQTFDVPEVDPHGA